MSRAPLKCKIFLCNRIHWRATICWETTSIRRTSEATKNWLNSLQQSQRISFWRIIRIWCKRRRLSTIRATITTNCSGMTPPIRNIKFPSIWPSPRASQCILRSSSSSCSSNFLPTCSWRRRTIKRNGWNDCDSDHYKLSWNQIKK